MSGSYAASAASLNGGGKLITLEGAKALADVAEETFEELGLSNTSVVRGRFQDTLPQVLNEYDKIDTTFIDGHHDEEATKRYWKQIKPNLSEGGIAVFDDIYWSDGMKRAWGAICDDEEFEAIAEVSGYGVGTKTQKRDSNSPVRIFV